MRSRLSNLLRDSIVVLRGARPFAYPIDMWLRHNLKVSLHRNLFSQALRSVRLALKSLATVFRGSLLVGSLILSAQAVANPFPGGDAAVGQKLFEQNDCNRCHVDIVGGDGNAIFTRANHKVRSPQQLLAQMDRCSAAADVHLSPADKEHVGAYLNRYYKFK